MKLVDFKAAASAKKSRSSDPADWEVLKGLKHIVERMEKGEFKCEKAMLILVLEEPEKNLIATAAVGMGVRDYLESLGVLQSACLDISMAGACAPNEPELGTPIQLCEV